jgi:dephospho-CoA kinase
VSEDQVVSRVVGSRGIDASAVRARIKAQMSQAERENRADIVIDNTGDIDNLKKIVIGIWHERVNPRITRRVLNR